MKPQLEQIDLRHEQSSFRFFKREDPAFAPFWHYHPELELTLITKGRGTRFIGDSIQPYAAMDLVLIGENLPHHWVSMHDDSLSNQEAYVFQFEKDLFSQFPECQSCKSLFQEAEPGLHFPKPTTLIIEEIIAFESYSPITKLSALLNLFQALIEDTNRQSLATDSFLQSFQKQGGQNKIAQTTNYILEHLDQKLTVQDMAEFTHMVPQSFCRWFKKQSGHSFISFLNQSRVQQACQLLLTTNDKIQAIAFDCGFESISHFNRTFRKVKGVSPGGWRRGD